MKLAARLDRIPPYLFAEIDRKKQALIDQGVEVINFGIGDPDRPTPTHVLEAMHQAIDDPSTHNYPPYQGTKDYRISAAEWMQRRFGVEVDPDTEVVSSIGSKEAIHNIYLAFVEAGDIVLVPDPAYPVYRTSSIFMGADYYRMPLLAENGFLPRLSEIPEEVARQAKLLWINYPNNPTGALAPMEFLEEVVAFGQRHEILICHDNAYSEMAYDGYKPPSILQVPGAKEIAVEFFSCSKSYNMTGWRVGFVTGNATGIKGLGQVKTNIDSGVFKAIQRAATAGFSTTESDLQALMSVYQERRDVIVAGLRELGWPIEAPKATLYIWAPVPKSYTSTEFCTLLLEKCGIVVTPGNGYGESGEGFFRIALTVPKEKMILALGRLQKEGIRYSE